MSSTVMRCSVVLMAAFFFISCVWTSVDAATNATVAPTGGNSTQVSEASHVMSSTLPILFSLIVSCVVLLANRN